MQSNSAVVGANDALLQELCERQIIRAIQSVAKMQKRLQAAIAVGDEQRYRGLAIAMLRSHDCKLAALVKANRRLRLADRKSPSYLVASAQVLDLWASNRESVCVTARPKATGGYRLLMAFGLLNKAKQLLVKWVLEPWIKPRLLACQHVLRGGRDAAAQACRKAIEEGGHRWATETDIKNCFGSINVEWLTRILPIPVKVIESVILARDLQLVAKDRVAPSQLFSSRTGIPQGSVVSPLIAEFVISCVLRGAPDGVSIEAYVDNVFCFANSVIEIRQHRESFERLFMAHPAGSFSVRSTKPKLISAGISVLGYSISRGRGSVTIKVSKAKLSKMVKALRLRMELLGGNRQAEIRVAHQFIASWCAGHKVAERVGLFGQFLRMHIARRGVAGIESSSRIYRGPPSGRSLADYMIPTWPSFPS